MDWNKQAEEMMQAWTDAQKGWWEAWGSLVGGSANPMEPMLRMIEQWHGMTAQHMKNWTGDDPITGQVAGQFLASQAAMLTFVEMAMKAWTELAAKVQAGADWGDTLEAVMAQARQQFTPPPLSEDMVELWSQYIAEWSRIGQFGLNAFRSETGTSFGTIPGWSSSLIEFTNLYWGAFERSFGAMLESPGLGYNRELNEKIAKTFDTWLDFRRASSAYQAKLADVWADAFEQLLREMVELAAKGEGIDSVRELLLLWGQVADRVFVETFRTDEYVQIQGEMLNAAMTYRIEQREITEIALNALDLPTRSEVDEAHRNIYELRKQVKALKKQVAELQQAKPRKQATTRRKKTPAAKKDAASENTAGNDQAAGEE